jgi:aryl-alcohol dehydrogenase-like predicted oxidoreductase
MLHSKSCLRAAFSLKFMQRQGDGMTLHKRQLGQNGPMVGSIGLGCMSFGGIFGSADDDASLETLACARKAGINFWDTANIYGMGHCETIIGRYLQGAKDDVVIATKASIVQSPTRHFRNDEDHLRSELDASLKRLGRDKVELFYIHRREAERPVEEVAQTLAKFIEEGLIGGYGLSEVAPSTIRRAHAVHPVRAVQNEYSLWTRQPELGVVQTCAQLGITFVPFSPLARGMLGSTPPVPSAMDAGDFRQHNPRFMAPNYAANLAQIETLRVYATQKGLTLPALALAWLLHKAPTSIPIPGTRTSAHLNEWVNATDITLSCEDIAMIESILPVGWAHGDRYSDAQSAGVERYC